MAPGSAFTDCMEHIVRDCKKLQQHYGVPGLAVSEIMQQNQPVLLVEFSGWPGLGPVRLYFFPSYPASVPLITWNKLELAGLPPQPIEWNLSRSADRLLGGVEKIIGSGGDLQERLFTRCTEFTSTNSINKRILIFGIGSVGASIAEQLVRCSCNNLTLVDIDVVDYPNLSRNTYSMHDISMPKPKALARRLLSINPACTITTVTENIVLNPNFFLELVANQDLIISCADDPVAMDRMSTITYGLRKPTVFPGLYNKCKGGEVVLSLPDAAGPCYQCITKRVPERRNNIDQVYGFTPQLAAVSAIGQDILQVTSIAAKLALALLVVSPADAESLTPLHTFHKWITMNRFFLLVITLEQEFWLEWLEQQAVANVHPSQYAMSYNWHPMDSAKNSECDVCGTGAVPLSERRWPQPLNPADLRNIANAALSNINVVSQL